MFKKSTVIVSFFFCFFIVSQTVLAQEKRSVGLSASFQGEQLDIGFPIWIGPKAVLAPAVSAVYVEGAGVDFGIGLAPRFFFKMDRLAPYLGGRAAFFLNAPSDEGAESTKDFLFGLAFGGEFFLHRQLSFGVEAQLNATISDELSSRFGNPGGFSLNTATALFASIYF